MRDLIQKGHQFLHGRSPWTPANIATAVWLDASDSSTIILNGATVSQWNDKSGFNRNFNNTIASQQPLYQIGGINGLSTISFDGVNDALTRNPPEAWAFQYPVTAFIVFRAAAFTNAYNSLFEFFTTPGPTTAGWSDLIKSNGRSAVYSTNTAAAQPNYDGTGVATYVTNQTYIFTGVHQNNSLVGLQNGNTDGSNTGSYTLRTNLGTSPLCIGSSPMFSRYTQWQIGEVIILNSASANPVSTQNRQLIEGYLAWKWGNQSSLPSNHPFKNVPPTL